MLFPNVNQKLESKGRGRGEGTILMLMAIISRESLSHHHGQGVQVHQNSSTKTQGENTAPEQALSSTEAKHKTPCTTLHPQSRALTQTRCWPWLGMCTTGNFGKTQTGSCTHLFTTSALLVWFPAGDTLSRHAQLTGQAGFRSTVF